MARHRASKEQSHSGQKGRVARRSEVRRNQLAVLRQSIDMMVDPVVGQLKIGCAVVGRGWKPVDEHQAQGQPRDYGQERVNAKCRDAAARCGYDRLFPAS